MILHLRLPDFVKFVLNNCYSVVLPFYTDYFVFVIADQFLCLLVNVQYIHIKNCPVSYIFICMAHARIKVLVLFSLLKGMPSFEER